MAKMYVGFIKMEKISIIIYNKIPVVIKKTTGLI